MSTFARDVERFSKRSGVAVETIARSIVFDLFSAIIAGTPVDTGRARGNWQMTKGSGATGVLDRNGGTEPVDSPGALSDAASEAGSVRVEMGDTYHLSNNLPYISRLEYDGWSDQAPKGMVRINIARIKQIVKKAAEGKTI